VNWRPAWFLSSNDRFDKGRVGESPARCKARQSAVFWDLSLPGFIELAVVGDEQWFVGTTNATPRRNDGSGHTISLIVHTQFKSL
jgi:hypothetical protein